MKVFELHTFYNVLLYSHKNNIIVYYESYPAAYLNVFSSSFEVKKCMYWLPVGCMLQCFHGVNLQIKTG